MEISEYFSVVWKGDITKYNQTGLALLDKICPGDEVLDVGCGYNPFKSYIENLTTIDPYNDAADHKVKIEDFETDKLFDVIFCLGSINFGEYYTISNQIKKVVSLLRKGGKIYWRQNPGLQDHGNEECKRIKFFPWNFYHNISFAQQNGCEAITLDWDNHDRIYAVWRKI